MGSCVVPHSLDPRYVNMLFIRVSKVMALTDLFINSITELFPSSPLPLVAFADGVVVTIVPIPRSPACSWAKCFGFLFECVAF